MCYIHVLLLLDTVEKWIFLADSVAILCSEMFINTLLNR